MSFSHYNQLDSSDCGPSCIRMIAKHYGRDFSLGYLRELCDIDREGVSLFGLSTAAKHIGFKTKAFNTSISMMAEKITLPCVLYWNQNHFVVCYKIKRCNNGCLKFYIADPASDNIVYSQQELREHWCIDHLQQNGIAMQLVPDPEYVPNEVQSSEQGFLSMVTKYLIPYKSKLFSVLILIMFVSGLQLILPFLTQYLVDEGIGNKDISIVKLILAGQLVILVSQFAANFIRSRLLLYVNLHISISLVYDFLAKLVSLSIKFFETKNTGDILQRIYDHERIKQFLLGSGLEIIFSIISFVIYGAVLCYFSTTIFVVFLIGNTLYFIWVLYFMNYRKILDIKRFEQSSFERDRLLQIIYGMREIKLNNCEQQQLGELQKIQVKLFDTSFKSLKINQVQELGGLLFNQVTNIILTYISAAATIDGCLTLGIMMSISFIIGQMNLPVNNFVILIKEWQDAKLSMERICEVADSTHLDVTLQTFNSIPDKTDIQFRNVSFSYNPLGNSQVLSNVSLSIPQKHTTAIVGASGSGKTTIAKLLFGFYKPQSGEITADGIDIGSFKPDEWRRNIGSVLQDSFIFSDTIAYNITLCYSGIDYKRLDYALKLSYAADFVKALPLGCNTKIGTEGIELSQGQKQRILIARVIYKNPPIIIFDEATNSLDTVSESRITANLEAFFRNRTVLVIAHRLSTVKKADNIIVVNNGTIVEQGTHSQLLKLHGFYYDLVNSQLC